MNQDTITLVRASWRKVEAIAPTAGALFYERLFAADPGLRSMFRGDMIEQGTKLMQMIGAAVGRLDDLPSLRPVLQDLARRHVGYGVREQDYRTVGDALLQTLQLGLADEFTPPVREAWEQVYGVLSGTMIAAARAQPLPSADD
jgi:hemoglobin-like flavoprotein